MVQSRNHVSGDLILSFSQSALLWVGSTLMPVATGCKMTAVPTALGQRAKRSEGRADWVCPSYKSFIFSAQRFLLISLYLNNVKGLPLAYG